MRYDAIFFDVDGTLWDARIPVARGWNRAYEQFTGRPAALDPVELGSHFGIPTEEIVRIVFPDLPEEDVGPFSRLCFDLTNRCCREEPGRLYPGVRETLKALAKRYPLYVVSNCQRGYIEALVESCHLEEYFSGWLCWGQTGLPKSGTIRLLMEREGLQNPLYVGDTQGDAEASAGAGIEMIGVTYGLGRPEGAKVCVDRLEELLSLL